MSQSLDESPAAAATRFTQTQGQYLAFIYAYSRIFKRPPAEADMRRHFEITAPTVHQMVLTLEKAGLIARVPRSCPKHLTSGSSGSASDLALNNPSYTLWNGSRRGRQRRVWASNHRL
jgi:hypothetical protein